MRIAIIAAIFLVAVGTLLWVGYLAGSIPHYQIHEVTSPAYNGEECRIDGAKILSVENLVNPLQFTIKAESGEILEVVSERHPPDNFKRGNGVGLRGFYRKDRGVFEANDVTTACPSKYEAADTPARGSGAQQGAPAGGGQAVP